MGVPILICNYRSVSYFHGVGSGVPSIQSRCILVKSKSCVNLVEVSVSSVIVVACVNLVKVSVSSDVAVLRVDEDSTKLYLNPHGCGNHIQPVKL